jgi:hypothetical protein
LFSDFSLKKEAKDRLSAAIAYCNMVNCAYLVNDSSLLFGTMEGLEIRGSLPVGEVGKAVTFHTGDANVISKYIREKYQGLKKFLECYPSVFVFGNDHEYNPHVFLFDKLSVSDRYSLRKEKIEENPGGGGSASNGGVGYDHSYQIQMMSTVVRWCYILPIEIVVKYRKVRIHQYCLNFYLFSSRFSLFSQSKPSRKIAKQLAILRNQRKLTKAMTATGMEGDLTSLTTDFSFR